MSAEFTGERVIPEHVDADLLNEHLARYAFAARLARGKRVLDAGCGAGYGSAEMAKTALSVLGADVAADAVAYAREFYRLPNLAFEQASCTALPHADASFDLVVAFEVVEHLRDWREFLVEMRRVLAPTGQFIVSTPNKLYYAESRRQAGPNPFHEHEFEFGEFRDALAEVFPYISLFLENHVEGVVFRPVEPGATSEVRVDGGDPQPVESHFFVAVCAHRPQTGNPTFVYIPSAANVLRERETHIALLEAELRQKNAWLEEAQTDLAALNRKHAELTAELDRANRWAAGLDQQVASKGARIEELQQELAAEQAQSHAALQAYAQRVSDLEGQLAGLERENNAKTEWATGLNAALEAKGAELVRAVEYLHQAEATIGERTAWAQGLQAEVQRLQARVAEFEASRWVRLGRRLGMAPARPPR